MLPLRLLAACLAFLAIPAAHAATFRAYLSITGNDANPCTLGAPCRLLPAALAAAADGGEIWMIDSGNYNLTTVAITKSVTILAVPGAIASILGVGADAINVNSPSAKVTLRNLVVQQLPGTTPANGLTVTSAQSVTVERCSFSGFVAAARIQGGKVLLTDASLLNSTDGLVVTEGARVSLVRTVVAGNSNHGIDFTADTVLTTADIADSTIANNGDDAIFVQGLGFGDGAVSVTRSNILGNGGDAVSTLALNGPLNVTVTGTMISGNKRGLVASGNSVRMYALDNTIVASTTAHILVTSSAKFYSPGTNGIGPGTVSGTITSLSKL